MVMLTFTYTFTFKLDFEFELEFEFVGTMIGRAAALGLAVVESPPSSSIERLL
jgi:hypothetical protein